jgi:hypothetical protein
MKQIWPFIYLLGGSLCFYGGFIGPRHAQVSENIDLLAIMGGFVLTLVAPLALFAYGIHFSKKAVMPRPSFDRHCFGWWTDTLQPLRVSVLVSVLKTLGALTAVLMGGGQSQKLVHVYVACSIGIVIGERLVYWVYKKRIATPWSALSGSLSGN